MICHNQIGARRLLDWLVADAEKFLGEVPDNARWVASSIALVAPNGHGSGCSSVPS